MSDVLLSKAFVLRLLNNLRAGLEREREFRVNRMASLQAEKRDSDARYNQGSHDAYYSAGREVDALIQRIKSEVGYGETLI